MSASTRTGIGYQSYLGIVVISNTTHIHIYIIIIRIHNSN